MAQQGPRRATLVEEYQPSQFKTKDPKKRKSYDADDGEHIVDTRAAKRILSLGRDLEEEEASGSTETTSQPQSAFNFNAAEPRDQPAEDDEEPDHEEVWQGEDAPDVEADEINPHDLETFNRFNPEGFDTFHGSTFDSASFGPEAGGSRNLADIILAKIEEQEAGRGDVREPDDEGPAELPPKVIETYSKVGLLLSRYKSGRLPRAFQIIPTLPPAMQLAILPLTRPDKWTPHAVERATSVFVAANASTAQFFLGEILLDRVREDMAENRKLNTHLYDALKKALYKSAAFFKAIVFPLLRSACTLREAEIVASVLARKHVPPLHAAAALSRCCDIAAEQMTGDVNGAAPTNHFIKVLLVKNYALPFQTVDALVFHFLRFRPTTRADPAMARGLEDATERLPVVWHQGLLSFAQRYKNDISEEQREALLDLLLVRNHPEIGPEVRRELLAGRERVLSGRVVDGDDTLMDADG